MSMELIQSVSISTATATIQFDDIDQSYSELYCQFSVRAGGTDGSWIFYVRPNGATTNLTHRLLQGTGSSVVSASQTSIQPISVAYNATASTYGNGSFRIPNYSSSGYKSISIDSVGETNSTTAYQRIGAGLWSDTSPITSLQLVAPVSFVAGSTASLYGIRSARSQAWATGGEIHYDAANDKFYHIFNSSGTFTPLAPLDVEYLVVAGGGGGGGFISGSHTGGGGGAGEYVENTASLTAQAYSITIGSGGAGGSSASAGGDGSDTSAFSLTANGGGGGGADSGVQNGRSGGSGGGGGGVTGGSGGSSVLTASGYGNAGGVGRSGLTPNYNAGGGGGAAEAGKAYNDATEPSAGGDGKQWLNGDYYAGGGGGGQGGGISSSGGLGGGGTWSGSAASSATANTGGGGAGTGTSGAAGSGGSGVVIVRYSGTQAYKARGGTITTSGGYAYHEFTSVGSFIPSEDLSIDYLLVAGGGGGGSSFSGGGGAGGYLAGTAQSVTANQHYLVSVGAGGAKDTNGTDTVVSWGTAIAGGAGGGGNNDSGNDGGSGGGGAGNNYLSYPVIRSNWGDGTVGQGNRGGGGNRTAVGDYGGGGGGASAVGGHMTTTLGQNVGGAGSQWLNGTYYAGGGGGYRASGGVGGGGDGGPTDSTRPGEANTGGGGGGAWTGQGSASGGSGIVIIRYAL